MKKLLTCLAILVTTNAHADLFHFDGAILKHNDVAKVFFTSSKNYTNVKIWTDSFKNGTNFDPITTIWRKSGTDWSLLAHEDDRSNVAKGQTHYDSGFTFASLAAGEYLLTIAAYANRPIGINDNKSGERPDIFFSQGFLYGKDTPIALSDWHQHGNNLGMGKNWSLNIEGTVAPIPEPETYALMGLGLVGLMAARRRRMK
jgi:hypothetical protein